VRILFTERIIEWMGGTGATYECAAEMTRYWEHAHHFELFDDVLPVLEELRRHDLKLGLLSNTARDLDVFVEHHGLDVDAVLTSRVHGKTKPHDSIFHAMLERMSVAAPAAVMVGDDPGDDVAGARAIGMEAWLVDREGRFPEISDRLPDLRALPAALGLTQSP
jgi:putative hydrolase of the HAD superfamily